MQSILPVLENNTLIFYIIIYIIVINIISFLTIWYDKYLARHHKWRISEKFLFIEAFLLGGIGTYIAMYTFRHKTKHTLFVIGVPIVIILNIFTVILLFSKIM